VLVAHLSDCHLTVGALGAEPAAGLLRAIGAAAAVQPRPDVLVISGDLVEHGTLEEYEVLAEVLSRSPLPVHLATGNHDRRAPLLAVFAGSEHLPLPAGSSAGAGEVRHVVEHEDARVVLLDSLVEPGEDGSHVRGAGRLGPRQVAWLEEVLTERARTPTLLVLHHPPVRVGLPFLDGMGLLDAAALGEVVGRHPQVRGVLAGHVHRQVTGTLAGAVVSSAGSTFRQSALELSSDRPPGYVAEPTTFLLHRLDATGYVVHTVAVSHAGAVLAV
jgi:3',5'-cyclic AMP phosphodiesterase CpdA